MTAETDLAEAVLVLGRGRLGRSLAAALRAAGRPVTAAPGRDRPDLSGLGRGVLVVLAVPDGAVEDVARALAARGGLPAGTAAVHLSGALGLDALDALAALGSPVGSFHPLQPFPVERPPEAFRGSLVAVDASEETLLARLEALAAALGARPRRVRDEQRAAYHAAASLAANLLVALADQSRIVFESAGWSEADAVDGVRSLMRGSLDALDAVGLPEALSGPVRRGDAATVARHVTALARVDPAGARVRPLEVYRVLGRAAVDVAVRCGLAASAAERIDTALAAGPAPAEGERRDHRS
jgi:predicted short-subunit dehydrogenase-like oxidoreductase (DUF2520 family)